MIYFVCCLLTSVTDQTLFDLQTAKPVASADTPRQQQLDSTARMYTQQGRLWHRAACFLQRQQQQAVKAKPHRRSKNCSICSKQILPRQTFPSKAISMLSLPYKLLQNRTQHIGLQKLDKPRPKGRKFSACFAQNQLGSRELICTCT